MTSETQVRPRRRRPDGAWPPDDTEESILGTDLHQMTITNLRLGFNEAAHLARTPGEPLPWQALSQITLLGGQRRDGSPYRTMPDIMVYRRPIDQQRGSVALALDGPPALVIEVLSESTYAADLDLARGKGDTYARASVREYLTIDVTGALLPERVRAWRLDNDAYRAWDPDASGRWQSAEIAAAIGLEGLQATVYTRDGRRQLREGEIAEEMERLRRLVDELRGRQE